MRKILVVEDEVIIARYIEETLNSSGYEVKTSNTVLEGRSTFFSFQPNIILMDVNLDDSIDGIDFSIELMKENKDLGVIFLTSDSSPSSLEKLKNIDYLNYILKPIDENQLKISIHLAFEKLKETQDEKKDILELLNRLTKTEKKILQLLANDFSTVEVSENLFVSKKTVENHRYNICKKLDLKAQKNSLLIFVTTNKLEIKNLLLNKVN